MKKITLPLLFLTVFAVSMQMTAQEAESATEFNQPPPASTTPTTDFNNSYQMRGGGVYSNGPVFNVAGGGFNGADLSLLEDITVGNTSFGSNVSHVGGWKIADDFELTQGAEITSITVYSYQTGSTTTSSFSWMTLQIWDGDPSDPASSVVYGDEFSNALTSSAWSGVYRASETSQTDSSRPIMELVADTPGLTLASGTYWIVWDADGSIASGPWTPFISILGATTTGNAKQYNPSTMVWQDLIDSETEYAQGIPFEIDGALLSIADNVLDGFTFYPNPTRDIINVNAKSNIENIAIFNVLGQQLINVSPDNVRAKVDMSNLSAGIYVMKATVNGSSGSFNIIKR